MHTGQVYPALARTLEYWSELQPQKLQALIGATPNIEEVEVEGEIIRLEVSVTWANEKQDVLLVEAVAYGPANWLTERLAEKVRIKLRPQSGCGDV